MQKKIFKIGDLVESLHTGLIGRVMRRGANHLICLTREGFMFKSWIRDVSEAYPEKKMDRKERVPGKPNTLVGTTGYLKNAMAMTGTAAIFLSLSFYAIVSQKDFSFLAGFLTAGIIVAFLAGIAAYFFQIPVLSLTVSAAFILLMSGLILYETSSIIHGGETNYIMATVTLYISIYNLFLSLLQILGIFSGND